MKHITTLRRDGSIGLPKAIRAKARLEPGDWVEIAFEERKIVINRAPGPILRKMGKREAALVQKAVDKEMEGIRSGEKKTHPLEQVLKKAGLD
ncbi:hypothetical protein HY572_05415 [Candidatus Micrarchaeota archaeon]|nr:hypothetical protein [Candidatus Micrarchaeota archaeon]